MSVKHSRIKFKLNRCKNTSYFVYFDTKKSPEINSSDTYCNSAGNKIYAGLQMALKTNHELSSDIMRRTLLPHNDDF